MRELPLFLPELYTIKIQSKLSRSSLFFNHTPVPLSTGLAGLFGDQMLVAAEKYVC